jgi:hypothetical protein
LSDCFFLSHLELPSAVMTVQICRIDVLEVVAANGRGPMTARSRIAGSAVALLLAAGLSATPAAAADRSAAVATVAAAPGAAGRDYATDLFADPWDYSNREDMLLDDTGPALKVSFPRYENGWVRTTFIGQGYVSPIFGGYGDRMSLDRDGARTGNALDTSKYRTISFEAYSDRNVSAGFQWFNCAGDAPTVPGAACQGGASSVALLQGWHTYVVTPRREAWDLEWGGKVAWLRLAVSPSSQSDFALDWMRVTEPNSGAAANWSNPAGGQAEVVYDTDSDDNNNTNAAPNWGVLATVSGTAGSVDLSPLPAGNYRIGVRKNGAVGSWSNVTLDAPLPQILTPNAVGDRDYATTVLGNPWDLNGPDDVSGIGNATNVRYVNGDLEAVNTSNDPFVALRVGGGGIDTRIYRNLTVTSDYDGSFNLEDRPGGGTMARFVWSKADGGGGQTAPILTYAGTRTLSFDMGLPDNKVLEATTPGAPFVSGSTMTALRWDPNEDPGARKFYLKDVQLRSDFATTGSFQISWQDAAYKSGGTATIVADTDRSGCDGRTVASGIAVRSGVNTTDWNTAGVPGGRYWLCLKISRGNAVTSGYAGGVLVVGANPPSGSNTDPIGTWDGATVSGRSYQVSGWAFDPNAPQQVINVDVYDHRPDGTDTGVRLSTGGGRPDVAGAYSGAGGNSGFTGSIQLDGAGRHSVCLYAINVGAGNNKQIQCRDVVVPGPSGYLDAAASNGESTLGVSGWASDPDGPTAAEDIHFYVSGPRGTGFSVTKTGQPRGDVKAAIPWVGPNSGFSATIPTQGAGENRVCAFAINVRPPNTNPQIGCRTVLVQNAFGTLDAVRFSGGRIVASGWALNPNRKTPPVEVHVYDTGPAGLRVTPGILANTSRPDVSGVYPGYGAAHGFEAAVSATGSGRHSVCVFAITAGGGAGNTMLGCKDVQVP